MRPPRMNPDEELADLQKKYLLLEGDRKAYYETSQWTIKQNRETILAAKKENKELRNQLQEAHASRSEKFSENTGNEDLDRMGTYVRSLRKDHDDISQVSMRLQERLSKTTDGIKDLEKDAVRASDEDSPMTRHIRLLENRLDKALIKYNEAQSIRKTYEQIVKRLREERIGFDNQLMALERTLKSKEHDLEELVLMSHDATHAKEVAKAELVRVDQQLHAERTSRERELAERRAQVRQKQEMNARLEQREKSRRDIQQEARGDLSEDQEQAMKKSVVTNELFHQSNQAQIAEEQKKITTLEEAFRKIKEATGVSDVNEVIQKFMTQEDTGTNLKQMTKEAQSKIDALNDERTSTKAHIEEMKYSGAGANGSRRVVDEFEAKLSEKNQECDRQRAKFERVAKVLVGIKGGTEHLGDRLAEVKLDGPNIPLSDDTVVDVLAQVEQKLVKVLDAVPDDDLQKLQAEADAKMAGGNADDVPATNCRVNTLSNPYGDDEDEDEEEEDDDGDDSAEVPDRDFVKRSASKTEDKATGKKKKKRFASEKGDEKTNRRSSVSKTKRAPLA